MACIEARGLRKAFGSTVAVDGVDLRVWMSMRLQPAGWMAPVCMGQAVDRRRCGRDRRATGRRDGVGTNLLLLLLPLGRGRKAEECREDSRHRRAVAAEGFRSRPVAQHRRAARAAARGVLCLARVQSRK